MLRKLSLLAVALAATVAVGNASATFFMVDNFDGFDQTVADPTVGGAVAVGSVAGAPFNRRLSHNLIQCTFGNQALCFPNGSFARIGAIADGNLEVINSPRHRSEVIVRWTLTPNYIPVAVVNQDLNFHLLVVSTDLVAPVSLWWSAASVNPSAGSFSQFSVMNIPGATSNLLVPFLMTPVQQNAINAGGTLEMRVTGPLGLDAVFEQLGMKIPEPTSIALVGLALLGAGVVSRRRKV